MKISFLGAAETVTGSCYLVETDQTSFLVDCGLHQGHPEETQMNEKAFPFSLDQIDFMLLTHAHIDHSGRIPKLYVDGYRNPIYATKATAELCGIMLPDSGHIQEMEFEWRQRKSHRAGKKVVPPLYTLKDAVNATKLFESVRYDKVFHPAPDITVTMRDAGHILGSAILEIWAKENGQTSKIVFSGDLGNKGIPILRDPAIIDGCDYLVIESTYGDRLHVDSGDKVGQFVKVINETIARGGNVIIPSFAVGRTQEVIYELNRETGKYEDQKTPFMQTPVYVDSPLATSATRIFRQNIDCYDKEARQYVLDGDHPLDFPNLHFTASADESKQLNISQESKIIISASGMCDAGRVKHHLKHNLWRPESTVLFVGFQARGTLGRRIVDGAKQVRIFGEEIAVKARIKKLEGFSGHADLEGLLDWINAMEHKPSQIMLVHGEPEVIRKFQNTIQQRLNLNASIAKLDQTVSLGLPVKRPGAAPRLVPQKAMDHRISAVNESLDDLQIEMTVLTEQSKEAIANATTDGERRKILDNYRQLVQQKTDEILARVEP